MTVTFDETLWKTRYPEFSAVSPALAQMYFDEASGYPLATQVLASGLSDVRKLLLINMLTAHIAWINRTTTAPDGTVTPVNPLVGVITTASEGSVSVGVENNFPPGSQSWYEQSKYGSAFWANTAAFRTARYRAHPTRVAGSGPWWGR